jgi:cytochrome c-type biogenesis protein
MINEIFNSFVLGLLTPLTAVCVLPLYPGYLSYLSKQLEGNESRKTYTLFGILVVAGVLSFMLLLGVVFSAFLQQSLTSVIEVVSPIAFGILGILSLVLILDLDFQSKFSGFQAPEFENPLMNAFGFGFFFGAIIVPCNPAFISVFFARAFLFSSPASSLLNFGAFGIGIGFPLLVFSIASSKWSKKVIGFLTSHETLINRGSGLIMLTVAIYYLVFVFNVIGIK